MKLKKINFLFENCESVTIDGEYIGDFLVDDIKTSIRRTACNSINRVDEAYTFAIEIHKDANEVRNMGCPSFLEGAEKMIFDRFMEQADIVRIEFELCDIYTEDEHYIFNVHWTGDKDYTNVAQKTYISKSGNLYIAIGEKPFEEYFDIEIINRETNRDFYFPCKLKKDILNNPAMLETKTGIEKYNKLLPGFGEHIVGSGLCPAFKIIENNNDLNTILFDGKQLNAEGKLDIIHREIGKEFITFMRSCGITDDEFDKLRGGMSWEI